ncbi:hypothetical protein MHYP_G00081570 [Metynnis hypsauchen]
MLMDSSEKSRTHQCHPPYSKLQSLMCMLKSAGQHTCKSTAQCVDRVLLTKPRSMSNFQHQLIRLQVAELHCILLQQVVVEFEEPGGQPAGEKLNGPSKLLTKLAQHSAGQGQVPRHTQLLEPQVSQDPALLPVQEVSHLPEQRPGEAYQSEPKMLTMM